MKGKQMMKSLSTLISIQQPTMVWGGVGVGKSEMIHSVGKSLGYQVRDVRVALLDPVDLRGVPSVEGGVTKWNPPIFLPTEDEPKTLLFLDELPHGSPSVQNALFQLVKDRQLGEYKLPESTVIVGAGNRIQDRAGANRVNTALGDRFIHLNLDVDADEWVDWAKESGRVIPEVIAYIRYRPENLFVFDVKAQVQATPRSWEYASKIMATSPDSDIEQELLAGTVGEGVSAELIGFLRTCRSLPSVDQIINNPESIDLENDPAVMYAVCSIIARKMDKKNISKFMKFLDTLPDEFAILCMSDAVIGNPDLKKTKAYIDFDVKHQEFTL
jgi:hypothetical protein